MYTELWIVYFMGEVTCLILLTTKSHEVRAKEVEYVAKGKWLDAPSALAFASLENSAG